MPGMNAASYMSPTERPSWSAITISTSDGGMIWANVPEAAITPMAITEPATVPVIAPRTAPTMITA